MNPWQDEFRSRMRRFGETLSPKPGSAAVSIKVRVTSGCFHREHSRRAYELIDSHLGAGEDWRDIEIVEHESGPEILAYLALTTSGLLLAKSIVELVTAIIKARSEGVKKGDTPRDPIEVIIRRVEQGGDFREEKVLRIDPAATPTEKQVERALNDAARKLLNDAPPPPAIPPDPPPPPVAAAASRKRAPAKKKARKKKR